MSGPVDTAFDPRRVPAQPVVDVRFDTDDEGRERAVVDGLPIRRASHETARESAIRTVAALVDRIASVDETGRRSPAARARVHAGRGVSQMLVVHRDGRVFVPGGAPAGVTTLGPSHEVPGAPAPGSTAHKVVAAQPPRPPHPTPGTGVTLSGAHSTAPAAQERTANGPSADRSAVASVPRNRWPGATTATVGAVLRKESAAEPARREDAAATPAPARTAAPGTDPRELPRAVPEAATGSSTATGPAGRTAPAAAAADADLQARADLAVGDAVTVTDTGRRSDALMRAARGGGSGVAAGPVAGRGGPRRGPRARAVPAPPAAPRPRRTVAAPPRRPGTGRARAVGGPRRRLSAPAAGLAALLVVALAGGGLAWSTRRSTPDATGAASAAAPTLAAATLPTAAPAGWVRGARWVTPALLPQAGAVAAVDDTVAFVTADRRLMVVDAMTGRTRWAATLPAGAVRRGPARTVVGGVPSLAMHVGGTLLTWRRSDGAAQTSTSVPANAQVTFLGAAPLVGLSPDSVGIVRDGVVRRVRVPGGATPLAASTDGTVTAASPAGWWHLRADVAPALPHPWEGTGVTASAPVVRPTVVGYVASSIVTVEPVDATGRAHVVVHTDRPADVRVSFRAALAPGTTTTWSSSPTQAWGVLGRALVDVDAGKVVDLGAWRTRWVADDRAYGTIGGAPVVAGPRTPRGSLPKNAPPVETVTREGGAVRIADGSGQRVYFLPPAQ